MIAIALAVYILTQGPGGKTPSVPKTVQSSAVTTTSQTARPSTASTKTTVNASAASFAVGAVEVADVGGYPTLKITFNSSAYPISFKLFKGGAEVSSYVATGPVAYLHLSDQPHANLGPATYSVAAYYGGREIWNYTLSIRGVSPAVEVLEAGAYADASGLEITNLTVSVTNLGDAPLYLGPDVLKVYLDGAQVPADVEEAVVEPNGSTALRIAVNASVSRYAVGYTHVVEVDIIGAEANYVIQPPAVELKVVAVQMNSSGALEAQVEILNNWTFPFDVRWLDVAISGILTEASWRPAAPVGPGGSAVYTLTVEGVKPGSEVDLYLDGAQMASFAAPLNCKLMPYRTIFWVVPWGGTSQEVPYCSTPGIVVVIPCTPGASVDQTQFQTSLALIGQYRGRGTIFVNLFCAASDWRGNLKQVDLSYASSYLDELKAYLGNGSGAYVGFSEMTACVANATCRAELAGAYRELKAMFPAARLYYYGTSSESPNDILDLAAKAGLDLVGEDIYDYVYSNGALQVPQYFLANLNALKASGLPVMVGEVGFRICDAQGYIQPWNWQLPVKERNCSATISFYSQVLPQLASIGPEYIGIWAWNDPAYGVALSPEVTAYFQSQLGG